MRSVRYHPGEGLRIDEVPAPAPTDHEVLIGVEACGLCGTDAEILFGDRNPERPVTLGHEIAGVVQSTGAAVDPHLLGRRFAVSPIVECGRCRRCEAGEGRLCSQREVIGLHRDGGLAELVCVPARNLVPLPDAVQANHGAIATDAVATPFHALVNRAHLTAGDVIVIFGIGGLGQHAVQLAGILGASRVIAVDPRPEARALAGSLGAHVAVDSADPRASELILEATGGDGADVALGFAGGEAVIGSMLGSLGSGGRAVMVAMTHEQVTIPSLGAMVQKETALMGSYGFSRASVTHVLDLIASGQLDLAHSVSHVVGLDGVEEMLSALHAGRGGIRRIVVRPDVPSSGPASC